MIDLQIIMEMASYNYINVVLSASLVVPVVVLAWKVVNWVWIKPRKLEKHLREQGFNGNPYRLLIGDLQEMSTLLKEAHSKPIHFSDDAATRIIPEFLPLINKYGKNSYIWYGPQPAILIQDPKLVLQASQQLQVFHRPDGYEVTRLLTPGVARYNGAKWAKHRKILAPAFREEKLKNMVPSFYESASEMMREWGKIVPAQGRCEVDVWPSLVRLSSDAISRTAFGSNYEEGRRIFALQKEQIEHCFKAIWSSFIPGWRFLPTAINRRMKEINRDVNESIRRMVNSRMNALCEAGSDLLGVLLDSNNGNSGMTIEDVIEECKLFYVAGQETTSSLLVWTMILLSRYEEWQTRARVEVLQLFGTNNQPNFEGLNRLKVLDMILHEALRVYPPVPINARVTTAETKLGDKIIPAGVQLLFQTLLIHYDPEIWGDDAAEFKPDRFSQGMLNATANDQLCFFPFGAGPRICMGQNYSMLEAKLVMAMILQRFSFQLSTSYAHAPRSIVTLRPQYGAPLILHKL